MAFLGVSIPSLPRCRTWPGKHRELSSCPGWTSSSSQPPKNSSIFLYTRSSRTDTEHRAGDEVEKRSLSSIEQRGTRNVGGWTFKAENRPPTTRVWGGFTKSPVPKCPLRLTLIPKQRRTNESESISLVPAAFLAFAGLVSTSFAAWPASSPFFAKKKPYVGKV